MADIIQPINDASWLNQYIKDSIAKDLCSKIDCTTCGAMDFRKGLVTKASIIQGIPDKDKIDSDVANIIARELSNIRKEADPKYLDAMRLIISDVQRVLFHDPLVNILGNGWAGKILSDMQSHHKTAQERRRIHELHNSPDIVAQNRQRKKLERQLGHEQRLEDKAARDRVWRESQMKDIS